MWRQRTICKHCGRASTWNRDPDVSRQEILRHLQEAHGLREARESADYLMAVARQCDYCLEPYLDDCTKCRHDFCALHAGDIDGLCGGCI